MPAAPVIVRGDEDLLAQALTNLVANAVQHCPAPATVTVGLAMEGARALLTVTDDGPGIPEADRERVRERFVRLDASRSVPGTGLGLSLVAAIAELHRARLMLEDNSPGLKVSILFPPIAPLPVVPSISQGTGNTEQ